MRRVGSILVSLALAATMLSCSATEPAASNCLARSNIVRLSGPQDRFIRDASPLVPTGTGVDARTASWSLEHPFPVVIIALSGQSSDDVCFVGGHITSLLDHDSATWSMWHETSGMVVNRHDFEVIKTEIENVGDGINLSTANTTNWTIRGVRLERVHDDCIENDSMQAGLVDDSLFDGCYVFYSARAPSGSTIDGSSRTVTITNSLVRLEPMPSTYAGPAPGNGPLFKMSLNPTFGRSPNLVIRNTIFRTDQLPSHGDYLIPKFDHDFNNATPKLDYLKPENCSNNTMVWFGSGPFPYDLPDCFRVVEDRSVWWDAVADWEATHSSG